MHPEKYKPAQFLGGTPGKVVQCRLVLLTGNQLLFHSYFVAEDLRPLKKVYDGRDSGGGQIRIPTPPWPVTASVTLECLHHTSPLPQFPFLENEGNDFHLESHSPCENELNYFKSLSTELGT